MNKLTLKKPDGRDLHLYSNRPLEGDYVATNPKHDDPIGQPHLRWHPLRGEWVAYASHRQNRTFLPPKDYSPLAVTRSDEFPTEMGPGDYEVAVFENLFPSLNDKAPPAGAAPLAEGIVPIRPANGVCEVVVFTQDPDTSLAELPLERVRLVLEVLADRTKELGRKKNIQYVLPFENRGVEMGVTLHHPHGQLYAYPFVPPVPANMLAQMERFWKENGRGLFEDLVQKEIEDGRRIVLREEKALSFIPVCARYPYETWVAPTRPVAFLHELDADEMTSLARVLRETLRKHDGLWNRPQPYLMVLFQGPLDGKSHPEAHAHFEIYPPYRTKDRLKYLAGTELGAGMFVNDSLPEEKAAELRAAKKENG
jgi:UDPglucose--hexose-1-phosphate uridylyltransferase